MLGKKASSSDNRVTAESVAQRPGVRDRQRPQGSCSVDLPISDRVRPRYTNWAYPWASDRRTGRRTHRASGLTYSQLGARRESGRRQGVQLARAA